MSDLKEFTASEMEGCPSFGDFISCVNGKMFLNELSELKENRDYWENDLFRCNPEDRMMAICGRLFKLMPNTKSIQLLGGEVFIVSSTKIGELLDINPFLHTDITEITREELG